MIMWHWKLEWWCWKFSFASTEINLNLQYILKDYVDEKHWYAGSIKLSLVTLNQSEQCVLVFSAGHSIVYYMWLSIPFQVQEIEQLTLQLTKSHKQELQKVIWFIYWETYHRLFVYIMPISESVWMCESRCISRRMSWGQLLSVNKLRPTNIAWTPYTTASRSAVTPCALYIWQDCSLVLYTHSFLSLSDERWGVKETQRGSRAAWGEDEEASRGTQKRNSGKGSLPVYLFYNNSEVLMTDLSRIYALPCLNSCSL